MNATVASLQSNQSETTILPKFIKVKKGHNSIKILLMLSTVTYKGLKIISCIQNTPNNSFHIF